MNKQDIKLSLDRGMEAFTREKGGGYAGIIEPIVRHNHTNNRVQRYLKKHRSHTPKRYIWHVDDHYQTYHPYFAQLQAGDTTAWHNLTTEMTKWATVYRQKTGCFFDLADCVQEAAIAILQAQFPYDTDFDPWARQIVKFKTYQMARKVSKIRKNEIIDEKLLENLPMDDFLPTYPEVLDAIESLSSVDRQAFVLLKYFNNLTLPEISSTMGKSIGAIYKLHFDVRAELRAKLAGS